MAKERTKKVADATTEKKKPETNERTKLSYEELEQLASQQYAEVQRLRKALEEANKRLNAYETNDFLARLDWLWRIITLEGSADVFGDEFYDCRVKEFINLMTPPKKEVENNGNS